MVGWRDQVLNQFTPQVARLTLVVDPDSLLADEGILQVLQERGFDLLTFEDPIAFRFAYESRYRSRWDRGEKSDLVVVLRTGVRDFDSMPYDLVQSGRKLAFHLGDLFPNLSYPVVTALSRHDLDALYHAQAQYHPGRSGDDATKRFVLRHVFGIAPEMLRQASDLLHTLLHWHRRNQQMPPILAEHLLQVLHASGQFQDWPLEKILPDREAFWCFLQERWPIFLNRVVTEKENGIQESGSAYPLEYPGPIDIPFDHDDVQVYIDGLFLDGTLRPVSYPKSDALVHQWFTVGIHIDPDADRLRRLDQLIPMIGDLLPSLEAGHQEWLVFARRWAELTVLWYGVGPSARHAREQQFRETQQEIDATFLTWIQKRYSGLSNQPALPPVMLHHIPRFLARHLDQARKVALVLLDGLALDQWIVLREALLLQRPEFRFREAAAFAWLPTITSVSRQAAFAGKPPLYYPASIYTTDKEAGLWNLFWLNEGLTQAEVVYIRGLGNELTMVKEALSHPRVRVVGLVVDKVDQIMHGMELGTAGMHNQVRQWTMTGFLAELLNILFDRGLDIFLTSDHGNVEAVGIGQPSEGVIADLRGGRVRIYPDQALRARGRERFPDSIEWPPIGLPDHFLPLLAPSRRAFVPEGKRVVGHGGISIEELIVPLIQIERRSL